MGKKKKDVWWTEYEYQKPKKKKHKKDKNISYGADVLNNLDSEIISQYKMAREGVEDYQYEKYKKDKKARKKYKKRLKKGHKYYNYHNNETSDIINTLDDIKPVLKVAGRLFGVGASVFLNTKTAKKKVSPNMLSILDRLVEVGMKV